MGARAALTEALVNTNLKGFFYPSQVAAAHMSARKQGHIINITASIASQPLGSVPAALPVLVKGGINQATKALALELAAHNVKVNAVSPGIIDTPLYTQDMHAFLETLQPVGRIGTTQDIVDAVLYAPLTRVSASSRAGVKRPIRGARSPAPRSRPPA